LPHGFVGIPQFLNGFDFRWGFFTGDSDGFFGIEFG
jgi:hypothetical protein